MPTTPPPDVPSLAGMSPAANEALAAYLRRLAAWAAQEIDKKIGKTEPVPQIMLYPATQKTPQAVFAIVVNDTGIMATQRIPFGGGQP
jgi:hypothetical protein